MNRQEIIDVTDKWLETIVIRHNFCPFAAKPYRLGKVAFKVLEMDDVEALLLAFHDELVWLDAHAEMETSLLIFPNALSDFFEFLNVLDWCRQLLIDSGYEGAFQLPNFHPHYQFDGADRDDVTNYTNRSPFPIIQILREESVTTALKHYRHPERIPERNMEKARELGKEGFDFLKF